MISKYDFCDWDHGLQKTSRFYMTWMFLIVIFLKKTILIQNKAIDVGHLSFKHMYVFFQISYLQKRSLDILEFNVMPGWHLPPLASYWFQGSAKIQTEKEKRNTYVFYKFLEHKFVKFVRATQNWTMNRGTVHQNVIARFLTLQIFALFCNDKIFVRNIDTYALFIYNSHY